VRTLKPERSCRGSRTSPDLQFKSRVLCSRRLTNGTKWWRATSTGHLPRSAGKLHESKFEAMLKQRIAQLLGES
jgi:hypothetical protein